ncbi:hypothetical protein M153_210002, partial [Pseudoloma neurophilia]
RPVVFLDFHILNFLVCAKACCFFRFSYFKFLSVCQGLLFF